MFLNTDNIRKKGIKFENGTSFFSDKNGEIRFSEIESFHVSSVNHFTNSVYQGHEYILKLGLKDGHGYYVLEACSNRTGSYETICRIHDALSLHMKERLEKAYDSGREIRFPTYGNKHFLSIHKDKISVHPGNPKKPSFEVTEIIRRNDGNVLELSGGGFRVKVLPEEISNEHVFRSIAGKIIPFQLKRPSHACLFLKRCGYFVLLVSGLNGWFKFFPVVFWVDAICTYAGILLAVCLFTTPFFFLAQKWNDRRMLKDAIKRFNGKST